jgi:hypothetical protein
MNKTNIFLMKKSIIILGIVACIANGCSGQTNNKNTNNMMENENKTNSDGYVVERVIDGEVEYRKDNILYIFSDGALTTIEQLNWGGTDELPLSYAYFYSNKPKKITYVSESGDKSQSETHIEITLEKTVLNHKYNSNDGWHFINYEGATPLDTWINLSETFDWNKFSVSKNGASRKEYDDSDDTITIETKSGISSVTNYNGNELRDFFKIFSDYHISISEKAEEKVEK